MSDHESSEPTAEKRSLFAAVNGRRVSIALVVIALTWLGVWVYTSDSAATSSSATVATVAPPATTPARQHPARNGHRHPKRAKTLTPPPNLARTPQAYTTALVGYWNGRDRQAALHVATEWTVNRLFARHPRKDEQFVSRGCQTAGSFTNCTWSSAKRELVFQVQNPSGSTPIAVVAVTIQPL